MSKVLLINMPFSTTRWPSLGISLLKPRLLEAGIPCDIRYFNFDFARMIGIDLYEQISLVPPQLIGDRIFAQYYFGDQLPCADEYRKHMEQVYHGPARYVDELLQVSEHIAPFLEKCVNSTRWQDYSIIGFTTMFEQNLAAVALAHRLKLLDPSKVIVFGGANCADEMGKELHRSFPFIDYVCSGEADFSFPALARRILDRQSVDDIRGLVYRKDGGSVVTGGFQVVEDMNSLPYPDFDDYFDQLESHRSSSVDLHCLELHMETSRGCWWGAKHHCSFCGLNGQTIGFRSKNANRVIKEIRHLVHRYATRHGVQRISMVDNILDMKYFHDLIPLLKWERLPVHFFYEVKANLTEAHVRRLAEAGIAAIQPGIESLSTGVLRLMRKGVTALQNIRLLRSCSQYGIYPTWNIIYGFPGETARHYRQMIDLIYKITHLTPPEAVIPLSMQRFSPYYVAPEAFGIANIHVEDTYRFVYPFDEGRRSNLAYFFDFDRTKESVPPTLLEELEAAVEHWRACTRRNDHLLAVWSSPHELLLVDKRANAVITKMMLSDEESDIYDYCGDIRSFTGICMFLRERYCDRAVRTRDVRDFLERMVDSNLMVREGDRFLSIAIPVATYRESAGSARQEMAATIS